MTGAGARRSALRLASLALGLALGTEAPAQEGWRGEDGPFRAELVLSDEAKALQARWNEKPGAEPAPGLERAAPGTRAETLVFFAGCVADADGSCKIWGLASVTAPDGSVLAAAVEIPLSLERPPPAPPALAVSQHGIGLVIRDAPGHYTFKMQVIDRVAGRQVMLIRELQVESAN